MDDKCFDALLLKKLPEIALLANNNVCKLDEAKYCGNVPEMKVSVRSNVMRFGKLAICWGMDPCNMFFDKFNICKEDNVPSSLGIVPDNPLAGSSSCVMTALLFSSSQVIPSQLHTGTSVFDDHPVSDVDHATESVSCTNERSAACCCCCCC